MKVFEKITDIQNQLSLYKIENKTIGFVPTMGALHNGHISLIEKSKKENDITVCSIFVNPIQFNNSEDLEKYPRTLDSDIKMLTDSGCDFLFYPNNKEIYPKPDTTIYDLDGLDTTMEGAFRPGHFNGVVIVVKKLFEIVKPNNAYFGQKDFQQLAIIKHITKKYNLNINIIGCPIIRENDGLAMSSRNMRLSSEDRKIAPFIYKVLTESAQKATILNVEDLKLWVIQNFENHKNFKLEYFEIVNHKTLKPIKNWSDTDIAMGCIAVYLGKIRLIDNIVLNLQNS